MYNQILLGPDCLCSRLLLGLKKKCAPKVICSFSAGCSCRAERWKSHFSVDSVILFFFPSILFLSPCVFSLQVRNGIVNLAHSVRRLNRQQCRCHSCHSYTWFHSNTSAHPLLCFFLRRLFGNSGACSACGQSIPASELVMRAQGNVYHLKVNSSLKKLSTGSS